jgi:hypothetical protein
MALRLTFGGSSCPNLWSCISEMTTDLCNMLIQNNSLDHKHSTTSYQTRSTLQIWNRIISRSPKHSHWQYTHLKTT